MVFTQKNYQVQFLVNNTNFSYNHGNHKHPAILVHDHSEVRNKVEFYFSTFKNESTFLIFVNTRNLKISSELLTIKNCLFFNGTTNPALHIFVKAATLSNHMAHYQVVQVSSRYSSLITVKDTRFRLRNRHGKSMVLIQEDTQNVFWKYRNSMKGESEKINTADFINCQFNLMYRYRCIHSSTIEAKNTQIALRNFTITNSRRTAVKAENSLIIADGSNTFDQNWGRFGGALCLNGSLLLIMPNAQVHFSNNNASFGGGIFAVPIKQKFNVTGIGIYSFCTITKLYEDAGREHAVVFEKNKADYGGNSIYGGKYMNCEYNCTGRGQCQVLPDTVNLKSDVYQLPQYINIIPYSNHSYMEVSSPANKICLCEDNKPTSSCNAINKTVFPGQVINISLIAMGELNGSTAVIVTVRPNHFTLNIRNQHLPTSCRTLNYSVYSYIEDLKKIIVNIKISGETPKLVRQDIKNIQFKINAKLSSCPTGLNILEDSLKFNTLEDSQKCKCKPFFNSFDMVCDYKKGTIHIKDKQWIGVYEVTKIAVTRNFPLDYLIRKGKDVNLSKPDDQCNFNRSKILCGACRANFSVVLGTSNCKKCSNAYLLLIIPFALAGVALVVLLLKCTLTVSVGHINGIIFYANIVQVNKPLLFTQKGLVHEIFSTFISWLNLDLGIETCFFANMDTYAKVCLQFVFPVYLWIIVGLIILAAHCSSRMGRLIGDNSVPVLATLLLLSYAKLLRAIIAAAAFTYIEFEDGSYITVWENDGNVKYLHSKHIGLFLIALLFFLCYILPLILLVLLASCLQAWSHHRAFRWVNRLKPFLDAYQGPYNDKFRFWAGLLLLIRLVLFVVYAINYTDDISMNFFWTIAVTALLIAVLLRKPVYRHGISNWIELSCLFNIVILCSVNWLTSKTDYRKWDPIGLAATYISVAVIMLTFLFSILYQKTKHCSCVCTNRDKPQEQDVGTAAKSVENAATSSVVELEECNQLKEPLLDSD